jgi:predicted RNase H-like nuclease
MKEVDETIFPDALKESIKRTEGLYRDLYHQATHHRSKSRGIHKEVLHAMALIDDEVVSHKDLEDYFRDQKPEIQYKHFIGPLGDLKKDKRGKVLKDYKETKGVTTFSNPMFKAFLRMKIQDEKI